MLENTWKFTKLKFFTSDFVVRFVNWIIIWNYFRSFVPLDRIRLLWKKMTSWTCCSGRKASRLSQKLWYFEITNPYPSRTTPLTPRRPMRKLTSTCPICRSRQFRWRCCLSVSRISPMFSHVLKIPMTLKTEIYLWNSQKSFYSSSIFSEKNTFYGASELWVQSQIRNRVKTIVYNQTDFFCKIFVSKLLCLDGQTYFRKKRKLNFKEGIFSTFWQIERLGVNSLENKLWLNFLSIFTNLCSISFSGKNIVY